MHERYVRTCKKERSIEGDAQTDLEDVPHSCDTKATICVLGHTPQQIGLCSVIKISLSKLEGNKKTNYVYKGLI